MGKDGFRPDWTEEAPKAGTVRSIMKWGDPNDFKHPSGKLYSYMKDNFALTDDDFKVKINEGNEIVKLDKAVNLDEKHIAKLKEIVGAENVSTTDYDRLKYSYGATQEEILEMRQNKIKEVSDAVVHPRDKEDVKSVLAYCNENNIPVYTYGGGSSVNFGFRPICGGISLVLNTHMNKIVRVNEMNKTCTVQAGMMGPAYEAALNNAKDLFGTKKNYTCGHFPQSFEYSSVGGWVAALGSGQESSYFGDAIDIVMQVEFVSPAGISFTTMEYPGTATGPKIMDIIAGSEGTYGVITELTMKLFYHMPENNLGGGFIFKTWEEGIEAMREISQGEFGFPGVMRISDPEETDFGLRLYGVTDTALDKLMAVRGYKPMERCLMLYRTCGEKGFAKHVRKMVKKICKKHGGMYLTSYPMKSWAGGRFRDPYLREDLNDFGCILDTTESGVTWEHLHKIHKEVRAYVKSRPNTACLTHASHFYPEGTNLYFIFFCKMDNLEEYIEFQTGVFEAIQKAGGSLSHHHGVGRMIGPWMEEHLGKDQMDVMKALKKHFDPNNIMNPGAQMGIDYDASDLKDHNWRLDWKSKLKK